MSGSDTMAIYDTDDLEDRVDEFVEVGGYESKNKALKDLVRTGLRENQSPILTRWRERAIEWAGLLALFGIVAVASGFVTPLALSWGLQMAGVLVVFSASLVGIVEVIRVATGQSALRAQIQEVVA